MSLALILSSILVLFLFVGSLVLFLRIQSQEKAKKTGPGYLRGPSRVDEYTELLMLFGLEDTASEEDIKKAYRKKMKDLHPDSGDPSPETTQAFMELKKAHDRLIQIKRSRFSPL